MGFRFHRSKKLLPGVRLNMSKSGPSLSLGGHGATVNLSAKGMRTTASLPGTGLSYVTQTSWDTKKGRRASKPDYPDYKEQLRTLLMAKTADQVRRELTQFEAVCAAHGDQVDPNQLEEARQLYLTIIAQKEEEESLQETNSTSSSFILKALLGFAVLALISYLFG